MGQQCVDHEVKCNFKNTTFIKLCKIFLKTGSVLLSDCIIQIYVDETIPFCSYILLDRKGKFVFSI